MFHLCRSFRMNIRHSSRTGETEVEGTRLELIELAAKIAQKTSEMQATNVGLPKPYDQFLRSIIIDEIPNARVSLSVSNNVLKIVGDRARLEILAENLLGLAKSETQEEHLHIEHFPDHFYLDPGSLPTVFSVLHLSNKPKSDS